MTTKNVTTTLAMVGTLLMQRRIKRQYEMGLPTQSAEPATHNGACKKGGKSGVGDEEMTRIPPMAFASD